MQLHQLKPTRKRKQSKRIGRGGKRGTYSGRGVKGQKSRSGANFEPIIRGLIKRYPKLRGYRFKSRARTRSTVLKICVINLAVLEKKFVSGDKITPEVLLKKKLISKIKGKLPQVKILGHGKLTKSLTIEGCEMSKSAKEKIEKLSSALKDNVVR